MMLKAKEIKLVTANEPQQLQDELNRLLGSRDSWTLHGDLKVVFGPGNFTYVQALVRLEPFELPGMGQVMPAGAPLLVPRG